MYHCSMEISKDILAIIAAAVNRYVSETVHDVESYKITIVSRKSEWNSKASMQSRKPIR